MVATVPKLEALLARIQQRAAEPREPSHGLRGAPRAAPAATGAVASSPVATGAVASSRAAAASAAPAGAALDELGFGQPPPRSAEFAWSAPPMAATLGDPQPAAPVEEIGFGKAASRAVEAESSQSSAFEDEGELVTDDDIEEYEDELIEIIDEADVKTEVGRQPLPIELSASAPSVELRRPVSVSARHGDTLQPVSAPGAAVSAQQAPAVPSAPAPLEAEVVARRPLLPSLAVAQSTGTRQEARSQPFAELLDASLALGE